MILTIILIHNVNNNTNNNSNSGNRTHKHDSDRLLLLAAWLAAGAGAFGAPGRRASA